MCASGSALGRVLAGAFFDRHDGGCLSVTEARTPGNHARLKWAVRIWTIRPIPSWVALSLSVALCVCVSPSAAFASAGTTRVSVSSAGVQGNYHSGHASALSADGRWVAFYSWAGNLVPGYLGSHGVFVHDRVAGTTIRVDVASDGTQGLGGPFLTAYDAPGIAISGDGRYVAFESGCTNLVAGDTNGCTDVFVHDCLAGTTSRVDVGSDGAQAAYGAWCPSISRDGRFVAFASSAINLVPGDTNSLCDIFVHDRLTGVTTRASVDSSGAQGVADPRYFDQVGQPSISGDGRYVAFEGPELFFSGGHGYATQQIYLHDRLGGETTCVSRSPSGAFADGDCRAPSVSGDGRRVAFYSRALNLTPVYLGGCYLLYVHDRETGTVTPGCGSAVGLWGFDYAAGWGPSISADGRYIAYCPTESTTGVLVYDMQAGTSTCVSIDLAGARAEGLHPAISGDGRCVAFRSYASNLVQGDTNGYDDIFVNERAAGGVDLPYRPALASTTPVCKPAIVLVGGLDEDYGFDSPTLESHPWHDVYTDLTSRGYDVFVVPSVKGGGTSSAVDSQGGYTGDNADHVQDFMNKKGLANRDVIMIGHSMGGLIARKWAGSPWLWRPKGIVPKGIIQLGTPNAGSPLAAYRSLSLYGLVDFWVNRSVYELDGTGSTITRFNDAYRDPHVPVLKLGGDFFFTASETEIAGDAPWSRKLAVRNAMGSAFWGSANDGAVSVNSLLAGPVAYRSQVYPVMHSDAKPLSWFASQGFIIPKRHTAIEDSILLDISNFCFGVSEGHIKAAPVSGAGASMSASAAAEYAAGSVAPASTTGNGDAFSTVVGRTVALSAGVTSTVGFTVEGTSTVAEIATGDPGLRVALRGTDGLVPFDQQTTPGGVSVAFAASVGKPYTLELCSVTDTSTPVTVLDSGPTALVLDSQQSGAGGTDALVTARLDRASSNLPGSFFVSVDGGPQFAMSDAGTGADAVAADGVYSAFARLSASGMAARVTVDALSTSGIAVQRTGCALIEIVEPRAALAGTPVTTTCPTPSGKIAQVYVDVPVAASQDCSIQVCANLSADGTLVAQSSASGALSAGTTSTVRVAFDAQDLSALPASATSVLADVVLYDSTDGGLSSLGSASPVSLPLTQLGLALSRCSIDPLASAVTSDPVLITGSASCTSESISGIDISLDGGGQWLGVPTPVGGWGSNETTWSCAFTLPDGEWAALVRLRGAGGVIAGAGDSIVFRVHATPPTTTLKANCATLTASPTAWFQSAPAITLAPDEIATTYARMGGGSWSATSAFTITKQGTTVLDYYSIDTATNREATKTIGVRLDSLPPVTTSNAGSVYVGSATITLAPSDPAPGSGLAGTRWAIDGGAATSGTVAATSLLGAHTLTWCSVDEAGNRAATNTANFTVVAVRTAVPTSITIRRYSSTARIGGTSNLSGVVTPRTLIGKTIVVWVKKPGKSRFSYSSSRKVYNRYGMAAWRYEYYFKPGMVRGCYVFKAQVPAWIGYVGSQSPTTVTIKLQ